MSPEKAVEQRNTRRIARTAGPRVRPLPHVSHCSVMRALGIPLEEAEDSRTRDCTITAGSRSAFVDYPLWWDQYEVGYNIFLEGKPSVCRLPLVNFVFENTYNDYNGRLASVDLGLEDLAKIDPAQFDGFRARKKSG